VCTVGENKIQKRKGGEKNKTQELRRDVFVNGRFDYEKLTTASQEYIHWEPKKAKNVFLGL